MKTGLLGPIGQAVENIARIDLEHYFRSLGEKVKALELEKLVEHPADQAVESVNMKLHNILRLARPALFLALATNLQHAYVTSYAMEIPVEADKQGDLFQPLDFLGPSGQEAADYAAETAAELVTGIDKTTQERIASAVSTGIEEQLGVDGTARLIRDLMDDMTTKRAAMIATTEMNSAFSAAAVSKLGKLGIEYKQIILADDPCPICEDNAAEDPIPVGESYSSGDSYPPFHPNCRCAIVGSRPPEE